VKSPIVLDGVLDPPEEGEFWVSNL